MKALLSLLVCLGTLATPARAADEPVTYLLSLDELGWKRLDSYGPDNPWDGVPREFQKFGGVQFLLTAKVQFHGTGDARDNRFYPSHLTGLAVDQRAARLHVLHGANMSDSTGKPIAAIRLNYADGRSHTLLIQYGVHVRDWWKHKDEKDASLSDTNSTVVWTGTSADAEKNGATHRLFKTTFDLPPSEQVVKTIDAFSLFGRSAFVLLGLTVEAPGPATPAAPAAPSADLAQLRDEMIVEVTATDGRLLDGARLKGTALDERGMSTLLGRMDDNAENPGVVTVDFPANARSLRLVATARTRGPATLEVKPGPDGKLPRKATLQLGIGERITGTVIKPDDQPLAKAKVEVLERRRGPGGTMSEIKVDESTTDSKGVWKAQVVPETATNLVLRVTHTDYTLTRYDVSDVPAKYTEAPGTLLAGEARLRMKPKLGVSGVVKDAAGQPVTRAHVQLLQGGGGGGTFTDTKGRFNMNRGEGGEFTFVVSHTNFAPFFRDLTLADKSQTVDVTLQSGGLFRGRVLEAQGPGGAAEVNPLSGVMVNVTAEKSRWARWSGTTDAAGRFVWEHAPEGPLSVEARFGGYIPRTFTAVSGTNEVEFALGKTYSAWGTIVDAESKQPVPEFTVTSGYKSGNERIYWNTGQTAKGKDGAFVFQSMSAGGYSGQNFLKIEAPGFQPEMFPSGDLGWRSNRLELRRAGPAKGVVKLPDGQPAAGAEILAVGEGHVTLNLAKFDRSESATANPNRPISGWSSYPGINSSLTTTSDVSGRFELPLRLAQRIVVAHPQGYAETTFSNLAAKAEVALQPWGQIEGVVRIGSQPVAGRQVRMSDSRGADELSYGPGSLTRTDDEGRFRFARVPPGVRWVSRQAQTNPPAYNWSLETPVTVEPGKIASAALGGTGRPVIGRVVPDDASRKVGWTNNASGNFYMSSVPVPPPSTLTASALQQQNRMRESVVSHRVEFAGDGSFRAEDVPAGRYRLNFSFYEPRNGNGGSTYVGSLYQEFEVGPMPGGRSDEPLDLGTLELKTQRAVSSR